VLATPSLLSPFMMYEGCLGLNPERSRSKQTRYKLGDPFLYYNPGHMLQEITSRLHLTKGTVLLDRSRKCLTSMSHSLVSLGTPTVFKIHKMLLTTYSYCCGIFLTYTATI
jgi:hypothetical protein